MFSEKKIEIAYEDAPRFDESDFYGDEEYNKIMSEMLEIERELFENVGSRQWKMIQRHMSLMYMECEFECMHFFQQGWVSAKNDT